MFHVGSNNVLRTSTTGPHKPASYVRAGRPVTAWSWNFNPDGRLKHATNVRADRHPSYPTQIWGGYGGARARPPRRTRQPDPTPNCTKSTPKTSRIHLLSPLFFLLRAVCLALPRRARSAGVLRLSAASSGRALPSSPRGTSSPARTPPWYVRQLSGSALRLMCSTHCPTGFFVILLGKTMDSDASSDEEYGPTELDQMIQDEFFDSSDSDEEVDMIMLMSMQEEMDRQVEHILNFKGSIKGRRVINRDRVSGAKLLHNDYFAPTPAFPDDPWFRRRFRMRKPLFLRIVEGVEAHDDYFKLTRDCCGQLSFSAKQKCTAALRMLALGTAADVVGEMVRMGRARAWRLLSSLSASWWRCLGLNISKNQMRRTRKNYRYVTIYRFLWCMFSWMPTLITPWVYIHVLMQWRM